MDKEMPQGVQLYSKAEVAKRLDVGVRTVERLVSTGQIEFHRVGSLVKFTDDQLLAYLTKTARSYRRPGRKGRAA
jgi:excisionase family DNA binding protein